MNELGAIRIIRPDVTASAPLLKSEKTQLEIEAAALRFLWSRPYRELSVNKLMSATDSSRSTFYQYFSDLSDLVKSLLIGMQDDISSSADGWLHGTGDPVALLIDALEGMVDVSFERGPLLRAVSDAATTDEGLSTAYEEFLSHFDNLVATRIGLDQDAGLIASFDPKPVAVSLNRMDASTFIHAFGHHPRQDKRVVSDAVCRLWVSSLYGPQWVSERCSSLRRQSRS